MKKFIILFLLSTLSFTPVGLCEETTPTKDEKAILLFIEALATGLEQKDEKAYEEINSKANDAFKKLVKSRKEVPPLMLKLAQKYKPEHVEFLKKEISKNEYSFNKLKSTAKIRNLCMGVISFTEENGGKLPDKLDDIKKYYKRGFETLQICPVTSQKYTYHKTIVKIAPDTDTNKVLIVTSKVKDGTISGFLDGHVEFIKDSEKK